MKYDSRNFHCEENVYCLVISRMTSYSIVLLRVLKDKYCRNWENRVKLATGLIKFAFKAHPGILFNGLAMSELYYDINVYVISMNNSYSSAMNSYCILLVFRGFDFNYANVYRYWEPTYTTLNKKRQSSRCCFVYILIWVGIIWQSQPHLS